MREYRSLATAIVTGRPRRPCASGRADFDGGNAANFRERPEREPTYGPRERDASRDRDYGPPRSR